MGEIEVELKKQKALSNEGSFCTCGEPARRTVTIGQTQYHYGTDYDLCENKDCLEDAFDSELDEIDYLRRNRGELSDLEHFEYERENGK